MNKINSIALDIKPTRIIEPKSVHHVIYERDPSSKSKKLRIREIQEEDLGFEDDEDELYLEVKRFLK